MGSVVPGRDPLPADTPGNRAHEESQERATREGRMTPETSAFALGPEIEGKPIAGELGQPGVEDPWADSPAG